jgi:PBSX family phage terminase large subunit
MSYAQSAKVKAAAELELRDRAMRGLYGSNLEAYLSTEKEVLLTGPAGTGKSTTWLKRMHDDARNYPRSRQLILRETRVSLTTTGLVTFEDYVLGPDNPLVVNGPSRAHRDSYKYPNGSEIVVGGMDNPTKHMSSDYDRIFFQEAIEGTLNGWESLTTRLRHGCLPVQQIVADTNPSYPDHWLKARCDSGLTRLIQAYHQDNPRWFNHKAGEWTEEGLAYLETLMALTGVRGLRLYKGLWVQAEGVVYDNFDEALNVTTDAEYDPSKPVNWAMDDGYAYGQGPGTLSYHPRVVLFVQEDGRGGITVFDEYNATQELEEKTIEHALERGYPTPESVYLDSSAAQLRGRLWAQGMYVVPSTHEVLEGVKNVRRMVCDANGVRLIRIHPRCRQLIGEFQKYEYDANSTVAKAGERRPKKLDDHNMDAIRYYCHHLRYD